MHYDLSELCEKLGKAMGLPVVLPDGDPGSHDSYAVGEIRSPLGHKLLSVEFRKSYERGWEIEDVSAVKVEQLVSLAEMLA
jgi:hypothetical protein